MRKKSVKHFGCFAIMLYFCIIMNSILDQDIMFLPGVGPKKKEILSKELGINSYSDLLEYYPYKYVDRSKVFHISELNADMPFVQLKGKILSYDEIDTGKRNKLLVAHFSDGYGVADLIWYRGAQYIMKTYKVGTEYLVFGKPTVFNGRFQFTHPDMDDATNLQISEMGMQPYYSLTENLRKRGYTSRSIEKMTKQLVTILPPLPETLPSHIVDRLHLVSRDAMALILTLEERIECSGGIHTIADHLHGKKVIGGALIVIERSAGRSGLLVVFLIETDLGTDEHKAVLTLPELEQIAAVLIVEIDSDSVIVHYGEACCEIVQRVETELLLPGVEVVNIEELALGVILVRKQSAVIERAQTELSSDSRIDIIELTEKVVLALVGDSLLESRDIIGVLKIVTGTVNNDDFRHALRILLLDNYSVLMLCRSDCGIVAGLDDSAGANVALLTGGSLCARG